MSRTGTIFISPSGNWYGSEQVLFDFLRHTSLDPDVALPVNSVFEKILRKEFPNLRLRTFDTGRLSFFYLGLAFQLIWGRYRSVYLNEAGHVRYILLLAKLFRRTSFCIHVRLTEDAAPSRWRQAVPAHVRVVVISKYIQDLMPPVATTRLFDPYPFSQESPSAGKVAGTEVFVVGIVGRITASKGIALLPGILKLLKSAGSSGKFSFRMYGDISADMADHEVMHVLRSSPDVHVMGFTRDKDRIYGGLDCVLHLAGNEPLGRVFLEALDQRIPLVGLHVGGIGELGEAFGTPDLLVDPRSGDLESAIVEKLQMVRREHHKYVALADRAVRVSGHLFSPETYARRMDGLISS